MPSMYGTVFTSHPSPLFRALGVLSLQRPLSRAREYGGPHFGHRVLINQFACIVLNLPATMRLQQVPRSDLLFDSLREIVLIFSLCRLKCSVIFPDTEKLTSRVAISSRTLASCLSRRILRRSLTSFCVAQKICRSSILRFSCLSSFSGREFPFCLPQKSSGRLFWNEANKFSTYLWISRDSP